jgi:hypothetical protein
MNAAGLREDVFSIPPIEWREKLRERDVEAASESVDHVQRCTSSILIAHDLPDGNRAAS